MRLPLGGFLKLAQKIRDDAVTRDVQRVRCSCWSHEERRIGWTENDPCPLHPADHVPEPALNCPSCGLTSGHEPGCMEWATGTIVPGMVA